MDIVDRFVEEFSFARVSVMIVFTIHDLKIINVPVSHIINYMLLRWIWIYRLSHFPVIFTLIFEETKVTVAVWWRFVDILKLVGVLMSSAIFIEEFSILSVISMIVLRKCYIRPIVPRRQVDGSTAFVSSGTAWIGSHFSTPHALHINVLLLIPYNLI